jgi:hypothetical protein
MFLIMATEFEQHHGELLTEHAADTLDKPPPKTKVTDKKSIPVSI